MSNAFKAAVCLAALLCAFPATAMASSVGPSLSASPVLEGAGPLARHDADGSQTGASVAAQNTLEKRKAGLEPCPPPAPVSQKILPYSQAALDAVGTQVGTGHSICCPAFSCAYGDVVMDGTVHDHSYYGCGSCVWTDWGGGGSSFRCVGTDEQLLREAYDQISAGKPTVIHVSARSGEHWICLMGYTGATDPDALTLDNFIALDPWDGSQLVAGTRFSLYGDGCEHISSRV